jgi:hypothetical protein
MVKIKERNPRKKYPPTRKITPFCLPSLEQIRKIIIEMGKRREKMNLRFK